MERRYRGVLRRFRKEIDAGLVVVHRGMSWDVAESFEDDSLDWVYIDADHSYESVRRDLAAYLPKVKAGGLITGDDYFRGQGWWGDGVVRAVDELIAAQPMAAVMLDAATHQWALRKPPAPPG
jgi:predicted O-methyltransferase YrrM